MKIGCVVLAAGRSVRFGSNKLLHPLAGQPVLSHVLTHLPRDRFSQIAVVASSPEVANLCQQANLPCLLYAGGAQSDSIRVGLEGMGGTDGCMFVMGDQPLCSRKSMERLADAFVRAPDCVVRLSYQGRPCSPVVFPNRFYPNLAALSGEQGGIAAVRGLNPKFCFVEAENACELWDTDTQEELQKMETYLLHRL